jgi:hypothetical protein
VCEALNSPGSALFLCLNSVPGPPVSVDPFFTYWADPAHGCPEAASSFVNSTPDINGCTVEYNHAALEYIQDYMKWMLNGYTQQHDFTDDVRSSRYSPLQNIVVNMCTDPATPGVCDTFLTPYCSRYNRAQVSSSNILTSLCGCYVPPDPVFQQYAKGTPGCTVGDVDNCEGCSGDSPDCVPIPACDPLCKLPMTVKKVSEEGRMLTCPQNVCVIDGITINQRDTTITGGINFNTICSGCASGSAPCLCIINSPQTTLAEVGVGSYSQMCGANSTCLADGQIVPCTDFDPNLIPVPYQPSRWLWGLIFLALLIFAIILFIGLLLYFVR